MDRELAADKFEEQHQNPQAKHISLKKTAAASARAREDISEQQNHKYNKRSRCSLKPLAREDN